jgi:DNA-binding XRE family transcriptional regulator
VNTHVTITREEYDRLVSLAEDARDLRILADVDTRLAAGDSELLPAEMVDRMIDGEAPLRVWREHRGLSQSELARRAGVHRVTIADIEAGRAGGSVPVFKSLADALGVTVDDLI